MAVSDITKEWNKKLQKKYFFSETPDWQGFFDEITPNDRHIVFDDFYQFRDQLGNPLEGMSYLPDKLLYNSTITEIDIPENVYKIGDNCFQNSKLIICRISGPVKDLPQFSFSGCSELRELYLPDTIQEIGYNAFKDCNDDLKIFSKKTGRRIISNEQEIDFLKNHFVED